MKTRALLRKLANYYPQRLRESWDYGGVMAGKGKEEVKRIFLCLDLDEISFQEAKKYSPDIILTHHPFFFGPKRKILKEDPLKAKLNAEIEASSIAVYSYHTNFDASPYGMNEILARKLELKDAKPVESCPMMWGGKYEKEIELSSFISFVMDRLNVSYASLIAARDKIQSVAIIGGGASREWNIAKEAGFDIYLSGDCPHHVRRDIILNGYTYLDLPHEVERAFMERMKETLKEIDSTLEVYFCDHEKEWKVFQKERR